MKNKIHYSEEALRDMDEIWEYIALELQTPSAAESTVNNIMDEIDKLESFPKMGTSLREVSSNSSDYRFLISGNYLVFYRSQNTDIFVDRILYGRRDYLRILFSGTQETAASLHIPSMKEKLLDGLQQPLEDCLPDPEDW